MQCFPRQRDPNGSIPRPCNGGMDSLYSVPAPESCGSGESHHLGDQYVLRTYRWVFMLSFSVSFLFSFFCLSPLPLSSCPSLRISESIGQQIRTGQQSDIARGSGESVRHRIMKNSVSLSPGRGRGRSWIDTKSQNSTAGVIDADRRDTYG